MHTCFAYHSLLRTLDQPSNAFALAQVASEMSAHSHNRVNRVAEPGVVVPCEERQSSSEPNLKEAESEDTIDEACADGNGAVDFLTTCTICERTRLARVRTLV